MAEGCSLLILAGGNSRRMGRDKATLAAGGRTLVEHLAERLSPVVDEVLVSVGRTTPVLGAFPLVVDRFPGLGPLAGIHAGLLAARQPLVWVVACDLPDVEPALGPLLRQHASGVDAVVPRVGGEPEGACALYRRELAAQVETNLRQGRRSIKELLAAINVHFLSADQVRAVDPGLHSFQNLNTPAEYQAWVRSR
jgi:molybdopterin-guanine dinucleotide biosynthesis protein A